MHTWTPPDLGGFVAVVTGASRGVGRGIAAVLGQCGAVVYITGRSTRSEPHPGGQSGTIEETAEMVAERGGVGIPVPCDHTADHQVALLFERVRRERGHLDLLVNNVWGGYEDMQDFGAPFWEQPLWRWDAMFAAGVRAQYTASYYAVPLMLPQRRGLIVSTTWAWPDDHYDGRLVYYVAKMAGNRMAWGMARELREHGITVVALSPTGWVWSGDALRMVRTAVQGQSVDALFQERPELREGESPEYTGRAVALLAGDGAIGDKAGRTLTVDRVAEEYGFGDIDGRRPTFPRW